MFPVNVLKKYSLILSIITSSLAFSKDGEKTYICKNDKLKYEYKFLFQTLGDEVYKAFTIHEKGDEDTILGGSFPEIRTETKYDKKDNLSFFFGTVWPGDMSHDSRNGHFSLKRIESNDYYLGVNFSIYNNKTKLYESMEFSTKGIIEVKCSIDSIEY